MASAHIKHSDMMVGFASAKSGTSRKREWAIMCLLALGTISFRCLAIIVIWPGDPLRNGGDGIQYHVYAMSVLHDPAWLTKHLGVVPPLYPFFLAAVYKLCGELPKNAIYAQTILAGLTSTLVYLTGRNIFKRETVGIMAACYFAVYPFAAYHNAYILRETLIILLVVLVVYTLHRVYEQLRTSRVILMSVAHTLLIHTDPRFLFYLPFVVLFILARKRFRPRGWPAAGICFLAVVLLSVPWAVRNYLTYGELALIDTRTLGYMRIGATIDAGEPEMYRAIADRYMTDEDRAAGIGVGSAKRHPELIGVDREKHRAEVRARTDTWGKWFSLKLKNAWWNFTEFCCLYRFKDQRRPWPRLRVAGRWSLSHNLCSIATFGPLLLLSPFGAYWCVRRHPAGAWLLVSPIVLHTALHVLQWSRDRYRLPMDPLLMLLSAFAFVHILGRIRWKVPRPGATVQEGGS